jgi:hypothetical protein
VFWRRTKPTWHIDPSSVALGSVIGGHSRNLSRSHVRVKYSHEPEVLFLPLALFVRRCHDRLRDGRPLDIEHLLVAPIVKRRYSAFFDRLSDWGPALRHARNSVPSERPGGSS